MHVRHVCALVATALFACASSDPDIDSDAAIPAVDSDGDSVSDEHEQHASALDSDRDGTPDYLDADSDGDGLTDALEAGDGDLATPPVDSDRDGAPDLRDTDSDDNGRGDPIDGSGDVDGDGAPDYADVDDDGDGLSDAVELTPSADNPIDSDEDGTPDFRDPDSDGDGIADGIESSDDYDGDHAYNARDLDSDGDCIPDAVEAAGSPPVDTDGDQRADFLDRDRDDDGVLDAAEDIDCDGARDPGETDASSADTDGDGAPDLVEQVAGTDGTDGTDNPQANGDFVFVEPYQGAQTPVEDELDFSTRLRQVDLYVMLDRSGSMQLELASIRSGLAQVLRRVSCATPGATGCIEDLWAGAGTIGYQADHGYTHIADVQPALDIATMDITEANQGYNSHEPMAFALWSALTQQGSASASGCDFSRYPLAARSSCTGSPAVRAGFAASGYPCFRDGALPVVVLATDEPPLAGVPYSYTCPGTDWAATLRGEFLSRAAKLLGVVGYEASTDPNLRRIIELTRADLQTMARDTGAIDAISGEPLVFGGTNSNAVQQIEDAIRGLATGLPLDLSAHAVDHGGDAVDAVASFVERLETLQRGTAPCTGGLTDIDSNGDTHRDEYIDVRTGVPVCWKLISKPNTTVPATDLPQLFKATVEVRGDDATTLDERDVYFVVPPASADPPVE
jgi:hypothetical protein